MCTCVRACTCVRVCVYICVNMSVCACARADVCEWMCECVRLVPHISALERVSRYYLVWFELLGSKDCLFLQEAGTESAHTSLNFPRIPGPPGYFDCLCSGQVFKGLPGHLYILLDSADFS